MSKFILFADGILQARYDSDIHGDNIPDGAIEVSDDLFFQTINETDVQWALVDGEIVTQELPPPPIFVPSVVSMRQARLALLSSDLLAGVNAAVEQMPEAAQIEWEYATTVDRNSQLVIGLSSLLNLDSDALDELFTAAAAL